MRAPCLILLLTGCAGIHSSMRAGAPKLDALSAVMLDESPLTHAILMESARSSGAFLVDDVADPRARDELTTMLGRAPRVGHVTASAERVDIGREGDTIHVSLWKLVLTVRQDDGQLVARMTEEIPLLYGAPPPGLVSLRAAMSRVVAELVDHRAPRAELRWVDERSVPMMEELPIKWRERTPHGGGALLTSVPQRWMIVGVMPGDVVVTLDGAPLPTAAALDRRLVDGGNHALGLSRDGVSIEARVDAAANHIELVRR